MSYKVAIYLQMIVLVAIGVMVMAENEKRHNQLERRRHAWLRKHVFMEPA